MVADDGATPILMDLGSCLKARIPIENRSEALIQQDTAAEHSTMAYRAPELFDVKTGTALDEKVDIWVLLSNLYCGSSSLSRVRYLLVVGLRSVRPCLPTLAFRNPANDRTRWLDSHGRAQCAVQTSHVKLLAGSQDVDRQHVKSQPSGTTRYPTGPFVPVSHL